MLKKDEKLLLKAFGLHLKAEREKKGLSLRELSSLCDVDNSRISKIESGKINLTVMTLLDLANALELKVSDLLLPLQ